MAGAPTCGVSGGALGVGLQAKEGGLGEEEDGEGGGGTEWAGGGAAKRQQRCRYGRRGLAALPPPSPHEPYPSSHQWTAALLLFVLGMGWRAAAADRAAAVRRACKAGPGGDGAWPARPTVPKAAVVLPLRGVRRGAESVWAAQLAVQWGEREGVWLWGGGVEGGRSYVRPTTIGPQRTPSRTNLPPFPTSTTYPPHPTTLPDFPTTAAAPPAPSFAQDLSSPPRQPTASQMGPCAFSRCLMTPLIPA